MNKIEAQAINGLPIFNKGDDLCRAILEAPDVDLKNKDILCVASKIVSVSEGRTVDLTKIVPSEVALRIHETIPRKDPRVIQVMLEETRDPTGGRIEVAGNFIGAWLPNGIFATSAGVDRVDENTVALLPKAPDASAARLGKAIHRRTGLDVGVIITDSDGRKDKLGATQIAIGIYGVPPLRVTNSRNSDGEEVRAEETTCDMLAATAALLMGQRGNQVPATIIRGFDYEFDPHSSITQATVSRGLS